MFIIIPLALIIFSLAAIAFIVYKKLPQLKSISPAGGDGSVSSKYNLFSVNSLNDFFPEIAEYLKKIKFKKYKNLWLMEVEKILRRLRLVSLKMDRFSDHLIKKIRKVGDSQLKVNAMQELRTNEPLGRSPMGEPLAEQPVKVIKEKSVQDKPSIVSMESLKSEEQKLIIEIAKNPKDYRLYETLGDLYMKMDNFDDAKESYEAAKELNPHSELLVKKHSQAVEKMIK